MKTTGRRDVTAPRDLDERYRTLFDQVPAGVVVFDPDVRATEANARAAEILGPSRASLVGLDLRSVLPPGLAEVLRRSLAGQADTYEGPNTAAPRDARAWISVRAVPVHDARGVVASGMAFVQDVSERRAAEASLARADERFRALIDAAPEPIAVCRVDGTPVRFNPAAARYLGYATPDEMLGRPLVEYLHPDERAAFLRRSAARARGEWRAAPSDGRLVRRDGQVVTAELVTVPIDYAGGSAMLCQLRDVTERRRLEAHVAQADRMAAMGTLAAGVAHEINNPLAYLMINLELIETRVLPRLSTHAAERAPELAPVVDELTQLAAIARDGAVRVRDLARDLRTYSRDDDARREPLDVRVVLDASINMAWNEIRHRARLVRDYGEVPATPANEARLGQVFLNLLVNAAQALPAGDAEQNEIRVRTATGADGAVVVEVTDTGPGLAPGIAAHIFDPFFTTKPAGVGTGLGLSICRATVTSLGGQIAAEPRTGGHGTTFRVTLPAVRAEPPLPLASSAPAPPRSGAEAAGLPTTRDAAAAAASHRGRVLVVDDDEAVARALRLALADEHEVVLAATAREALAILARDPEFDLVLCDVMMPDVTGKQLWEHLQAQLPEVAARVVFVTGGAFSDALRDFAANARAPVLAKPFDLAEVRALIRRRLR